MASPAAPHIVIFPFLAYGHLVPLLDLSKAFTQRNIKITIITTPGNVSFIHKHFSRNPQVHITEIPFPITDDLPKGCENTAQLPSMAFYMHFLKATRKLQEPFHQILQHMSQSNNLPICVISDFFLGWTLPICHEFGVPRLVFHGMSVFGLALSKTVWVHMPHLHVFSDTEPLNMPGLELPFTLTRLDVPEMLQTPDHNDPISRLTAEDGQSELDSWGVIVNSFLEIEEPYVPSLESFFVNGAKSWCVGPLILYDPPTEPVEPEHPMILKFLADHAMPESVIYVAFGTQADVSNSQLDEVAFGLEMSGHPFIWVVRSKNWSIPNGLEEGVKGRGLIMREWVDQRRVLAHRSTGGFLSHCGWNSVLESICEGIPVLAWPMMADQFFNARLVVDGLGAGLSVASVGPEEIVGRKAISECVIELMGEEKGKNARDRVKELSLVARKAVQEGGSSYDNLSRLIDQLGVSEPSLSMV
ncbi:hypothetical protein NE237_024506 [Protea cynaroides]|uniref:Glycosyltransferase n=1 Tax=Protea cynaroides TaxID=273540 RepID=A0A9Q0K0H1_9MAGN|nr:hypothetical protein NE237_024506 [Protea cynaroides]